MKVRKFKFKQILKLYLLKSRIYEQVIKKHNSKFSIDLNLTQLITNLKKVLQIIFQYDRVNKRILFIGVPKRLEFKINKLTNHVAVPDDFNLQSISSGGLSSLNSQKFHLFLPKLYKKPDLIVLFSHKKKQSFISDSSFSKIPLMVVNDQDLRNASLYNVYNVPGNEKNLINTYTQNLFFISLNFLFNNNQKRMKKQKSVNFVSKNVTSKFKSVQKD